MDNKKQLRNEMKQLLMQMTKEEYTKYSEEITEKLINSTEWIKAKTIGITISTGREVNTHAIIDTGWKEGKQIVVPKCFPEKKQMKFFQIKSFDEVEDSFYSLKEPITTITPLVRKEHIDLLIVPGLVYDKRGYRIGFGGGYYDRYLANYKNKTLSLAFHFQVIEEVPYELYDIPVEKIITNTY